VDGLEHMSYFDLGESGDVFGMEALGWSEMVHWKWSGNLASGCLGGALHFYFLAWQRLRLLRLGHGMLRLYDIDLDSRM
jgi:hypothetical protein